METPQYQPASRTASDLKYLFKIKMFKILALVVAVCTAQFFDCEKQLERA
jgi:hypothetical protein